MFLFKLTSVCPYSKLALEFGRSTSEWNRKFLFYYLVNGPTESLKNLWPVKILKSSNVIDPISSIIHFWPVTSKRNLGNFLNKIPTSGQQNCVNHWTVVWSKLCKWWPLHALHCFNWTNFCFDQNKVQSKVLWLLIVLGHFLIMPHLTPILTRYSSKKSSKWKNGQKSQRWEIKCSQTNGGCCCTKYQFCS